MSSVNSIQKQNNTIREQNKTLQKQILKHNISILDKIIEELKQEKKKLSFFNFSKKREINAKINTNETRKKELEKKLNETFAPSVISPCTFQIIKIVIVVLFLVLLIKIYSRLSVFSSINEFYTSKQDTKTFN